MSQAEAERFVEDLKADNDLLESLKAEATTLDAVVAFAKDKGYDLDLNDAREYIRSQAQQELNDEELDSVAGGKSDSDVDIELDGSTVTLATTMIVTA